MGEDVSATKLRGVSMDRAEIDQFLREQGTGVLSLADAGETYAPPMSFGYDGDRLYFVMIRFGDDSTKLDFADTTTRATLTTYVFEDAHHWRSVMVRGSLEGVPDERVSDADDVLFDNAQFASLFPHGEPMTDRPRYQLTVEDVTGQKGQGYDV